MTEIDWESIEQAALYECYVNIDRTIEEKFDYVVDRYNAGEQVYAEYKGWI